MMNDYKTRLAHYNDTEWREPIVPRWHEGTLFMHTEGDVQQHDVTAADARFFNRLTLLVLVAVALWLSVLPGLAAGAILGGLLILAVNNVEEALGDE